MTVDKPNVESSYQPDGVAVSQLDKFKEAARNLECDDDEARFDDRVKKLVKPTPSGPRSEQE